MNGLEKGRKNSPRLLNGGEMRENQKLEKLTPFSPKLLVCLQSEEEDEVWGFLKHYDGSFV